MHSVIIVAPSLLCLIMTKLVKFYVEVCRITDGVSACSCQQPDGSLQLSCAVCQPAADSNLAVAYSCHVRCVSLQLPAT